MQVLWIGGEIDETRTVGMPLPTEGVGVEHAPDMATARRMLASCVESPVWIVVRQSRPGEYSNQEIDALRRLAPFARWRRLLGTWCEGEPRSGRPPAGCLSSYWHQWPARWRGEQVTAQRGGGAVRTLPATASPEEQTIERARLPLESAGGLIAICARQGQTAAALAEVCRSANYSMVILSDDRACAHGARAVLWDTWPQAIADRAAIAAVARRVASAPIVAVVGFPRAEDCRLAADAGVAAVVSKPYLIHELCGALAQAVASPRSCAA